MSHPSHYATVVYVSSYKVGECLSRQGQRLRLRVQSPLQFLSLILFLGFAQAGHAVVFDPTINLYACNGSTTRPPKLGFHDVGYGVKLSTGKPALYYVERSTVLPVVAGPEQLQLYSQGWTIVNNCTNPRSYWIQFLTDRLFFPSLYEYILPFGAGPKNNGKVCPVSGDSVNSATGNNYQQQVDHPDSSSGLPGFERHYNSFTSFAASPDMGNGWSHTFSRTIFDLRERGGSGVSVSRPDGKVFSFTNNNNAWVSTPDVVGQLSEIKDTNGVQTGWAYTSDGNDREEYDIDGHLRAIIQRTGRTSTLEYDTNKRLLSVNSSTGQSLGFSYDVEGRISTITVPGNEQYQYAYDDKGNLASVTYPDTAVRQYRYEDTRLPHALTGIIDGNGDRYATWEYDDMGRTILSERSGGVERVELTYSGDGMTTVRDVKGNIKTYQFEITHGVVKPVIMD